MRRLGILAAWVAMLVAGCGTVQRAPDFALAAASQSLAPAEEPRLDPYESAAMKRYAEAVANRANMEGRAPRILALSGGGANGAYGAGVLIGWTDNGRPEFDVVTGVSTGALAAPFAFLGPDWDEQLRAAYVNAEVESILSWRTFAAFFLPGAFSSRTLEALVEENVTPELLRRIAAEHRQGRRLYVGTTDLDRGRGVIWDMGAIAQNDDENALRLFREVLLASASIPGVFPPVLITAMEDDGRLAQSLHVDGAVNAAFIGVPEGLIGRQTPLPEWRGAELYVIVNGRVVLNTQATRGSLLAIAMRAIDVFSNASLRASLQNQAAFARSHGAALYVAAIPDAVESSSLGFDQDAMQQLLDLGVRRARAGEVFTAIEGPVTELAVPAPTDETESPLLTDGAPER